MAKKKSSPKKKADEPIMDKIADTFGNIKDEIIVAKNRLVEMAGDAMDSVKETFQNVTAKKPVTKKAVKAAGKNDQKKTAPKKAVKKAAKKASPAKKAVKKVAKKAAVKAAPAKKSVKKVAKKNKGESRSIKRR